MPDTSALPQLDDPITAAVHTMLSCPLQIQLTGAGLQPFKGKELTFPYACMTKDQRDFLFGLLGYDDASVTWNRLVCLGFFFFDSGVFLTQAWGTDTRPS